MEILRVPRLARINHSSARSALPRSLTTPHQRHTQAAPTMATFARHAGRQGAQAAIQPQITTLLPLVTVAIAAAASSLASRTVYRHLTDLLLSR